MMIPLLLVLANLAAMFGGPLVVLHLTGSAEWAMLAASVPWLANGFIVGNYWAIRRSQKKGHTGSQMGALPFVWMFMLTPAAVTWAALAALIALLTS